MRVGPRSNSQWQDVTPKLSSSSHLIFGRNLPPALNKYKKLSNYRNPYYYSILLQVSSIITGMTADHLVLMLMSYIVSVQTSPSNDRERSITMFCQKVRRSENPRIFWCWRELCRYRYINKCSTPLSKNGDCCYWDCHESWRCHVLRIVCVSYCII